MSIVRRQSYGLNSSNSNGEIPFGYFLALYSSIRFDYCFKLWGCASSFPDWLMSFFRLHSLGSRLTSYLYITKLDPRDLKVHLRFDCSKRFRRQSCGSYWRSADLIECSLLFSFDWEDCRPCCRQFGQYIYTDFVTLITIEIAMSLGL